ncbi:MAG TPA: sigma-70 family RNA polymerase sigma factor [Ktedonobacteraceae bacterium]|nr:sigma-70 family RNA polymerase sigma factor [Ktedonobacteraceae bacterium]
MQQADVFHAYKPLLFSIAYHMLGSIMDAEDCVQEAFLRWYQAKDLDEIEAVRSPKSYLSTMVTRLCIDQLRSARAQRERYVGIWLPEPLVTIDETSLTGMAERWEALSLAFLRLLEQLSPLERAVFLLHQVFDYDYAEIAAIVHKSADNCRQIGHRARQHLQARHSPYHASKEQHATLLHQFRRACTSGDMDGLLALLANDIVAYTDGGGKAIMARNPIYGADKVMRFLLGVGRKLNGLHSFTVRRANINGWPGMVTYINDLPYFILVLDSVDGHIQEIDIVANPDKLHRVPARTYGVDLLP